ncbi:sigma-70 family RNA polymerase sigma factor [Cupriavidus basilensis]|uniref:Sigma-70 family RNA polymerase sigma factor n=1 Tax=Cupriavidus basilensis TaxID=68895 RepID=A0ABT6API9_9BURK|nr:sigma-70 family RNA polymerase sigma factor [Cupriavidus basilensis]MDF3834540.1 sigma-70 family RNA polymerase sigma factor [Cupriavidus basilensis]
MTEDARVALTDYLTKHYANLRRRLTRLLGNGDLAGDALQDTWLRLQGQEDKDSIRSPAGYVVRMAVNIAVDIQRRQSRSVPFDEVSALMEQADPAPNPAQAVEIRSDLETLLKLMERLPERRRKILMLVRLEHLQQKEVAERLGISKSIVEHELRRAHDFLDVHMNNDKK